MQYIITRASLLLVGALLVLPGVALAQQGGDLQILDEYEVVPAGFREEVTATGAIEPARSVDLNFEMSAPVEEIMVQEGDSVRRGDVLARLESDDLRAGLRESEIALELQQLAYEALIDPPRDVDVAAAEAAVEAAAASVSSAGFGPTQEQIRIAELQAQLSRNQLWQTQIQRDIHFQIGPEFRGGRAADIQQESSVTRAEFDVAVSQANIEATRRSGGGAGAIANAEAQLVRAQVALDDLLSGPDQVQLLNFEIQLDQAELALEQAQVALERTELEAPFDGIIAQNNLTVGELPPQGPGGAIQVVDNSTYFVELGIDESDVVDIQNGQPVSLRLDALPEANVTGEITQIDLLPDPAASTVVYRARVQLNPSTENIRVGMSTTASITTQELQDVLVVPNRFIRIEPDTQQAYVTIQSGENSIEEIEVTLGARNSNNSVITSGVEPGQRLVQVPRETLGLEDALNAAPQ